MQVRQGVEERESLPNAVLLQVFTGSTNSVKALKEQMQLKDAGQLIAVTSRSCELGFRLVVTS